MRLLDALDGFEAALGLFRGRAPERSDVVEFAESGIVTSAEVKPPVPKSDWVWRMAAAPRRGLHALAIHPEPGAAFNSMCAGGGVVGVPLSGSLDDLGTSEALEAYLRGRETRRAVRRGAAEPSRTRPRQSTAMTRTR